MGSKVEALEEKIWDDYFTESLCGQGQEVDNENTWWSISERDTIIIIKDLFGNKKFNLLEAGCGSGGTSFSVAKELNVVGLDLMDVSQQALKYANSIEPDCLNVSVKYQKGSILNRPRKGGIYDLVWNTGLIEHYNKKEIIRIINNMIFSAKSGGIVVIGIPNRKSIAVLKAAFLGTRFARKYLSFIKGYRNTTEILYSDTEIKKLIKDNFKKYCINIKYAGSPVLVGSPNFIVRAFDSIFKRTRFSFLTYFIIRKGA